MCSSPQCRPWRTLKCWQRLPDTYQEGHTTPLLHSPLKPSTMRSLISSAGGLLCQNPTQSPLKQMVKEHPDAPKQFGIRISDDVMELVAEIQEYRKLNSQPFTLAAVVESAIQCHYARLVKEGAIEEDDVL